MSHLNAHKIEDDNDKDDFTTPSKLKKLDWKRDYSFENKAAIDAECMSGCFGKNTQIIMNNGKEKDL